jgi:hypothetical protein
MLDRLSTLVIRGGRRDTGRGPAGADHREDAMTAWGSYSFLFGPLLALLAIGVIVLLLRWAFSSGHSLVERRPRQGTEVEYGLLVTVASPTTFVEAEVIRQTLEAAGVRATLAPTVQGPRVMVFPEDASVARALLNSPSP